MKQSVPKIFVDMDGVWADFEKARQASGLPADEYKLRKGAYRHLDEVEGASASIDLLLSLPADVYIATKIPTHAPFAATEKLEWIEERKPQLLERTIITPNKGLLGSRGDFLIDDRPHKAHCLDFEGSLIVFGGREFPGWRPVLSLLLEHFLGPDRSPSYLESLVRDTLGHEARNIEPRS